MAITEAVSEGAQAIARADAILHRLTATPEGWAEPYPLYHRLRELAPLYRSGLDGVWYASSFEACRTVLGHAAIGKSDQFIVNRHGVDPERVKLAQRRRQRSMITSDPPEHTRLRGVAKGAFIPPSMESIRPRVAEIVEERLDRLAECGEADVMAELAFPLPVTVIGEMIGVPEEDRAWFRPLMNTLVTSDFSKASPDQLGRVEQAGNDLEAYFLDLIEARSREPRADLLSEFVARRDAGDLSAEELFGTVLLLFIAGFLTTTNLIGNGLLALFEHPAELERLWAEPGLVPSGVEEMLRYDTPVPMIHRQVLEDVEIGGQTLRAGDIVFTLLGAANRDPARFLEPDRFDVARPDNLHLSFAWGLHFCLGARLARMEGQLVFEGLRRRFSKVEPAGPWERRPGLAFRALDSLPVRVSTR